jgi:hypothetical protein
VALIKASVSSMEINTRRLRLDRRAWPYRRIRRGRTGCALAASV